MTTARDVLDATYTPAPTHTIQPFRPIVHPRDAATIAALMRHGTTQPTRTTIAWTRLQDDVATAGPTLAAVWRSQRGLRF